MLKSIFCEVMQIRILMEKAGPQVEHHLYSCNSLNPGCFFSVTEADLTLRLVPHNKTTQMIFSNTTQLLHEFDKNQQFSLPEVTAQLHFLQQHVFNYTKAFFVAHQIMLTTFLQYQKYSKDAGKSSCSTKLLNKAGLVEKSSVLLAQNETTKTWFTAQYFVYLAVPC